MIKIRLNDRLLEYWGDLRFQKGTLPSEDQIDPDAIEAIWPDCFFVQIQNNRQHVAYSYLGKNLIEAYGEGYIPRENSVAERLIAIDDNSFMKPFLKVIETSDYVVDEGEFINHQDLTIRYRQILLPFSDSGETVTHILGGVRWKAFME